MIQFFPYFINLSGKKKNQTKTTKIGVNKKPKQFDLLDIEVRYSSIQRLTREQNTNMLYINLPKEQELHIKDFYWMVF